MDRAYFRISLDVQDQDSGIILRVKQGDTGRGVIAALRVDGRKYTIAADCTAVLSGGKPDGTALYNACTVEGNTVRYDFTPQTTAALGVVCCELRLFDTAGDLILTSATFSLLVEEGVYDEDATISTAEASELQKLVNTASALVDEVTTALDNGDFVGPQGPQGEKGDKGDKGDTGETGATGAAFTYSDFTEEQLAALKGEKGDKGDAGETGPQGENGATGADGASAYQVAVNNGYTGTESEWLASLKGEKGDTGEKGADGTMTFEDLTDEQKASLKGDKGDTGETGAAGASAYEVAVAAGYTGTETEWLASLKGEKGDTGETGPAGASAYEIAVANGFSGTESEWLESLKNDIALSIVDGLLCVAYEEE